MYVYGLTRQVLTREWGWEFCIKSTVIHLRKREYLQFAKFNNPCSHLSLLAVSGEKTEP